MPGTSRHGGKTRQDTAEQSDGRRHTHQPDKPRLPNNAIPGWVLSAASLALRAVPQVEKEDRNLPILILKDTNKC